MIKILVATKETQGARENDFSWTLDGEVVMFGAIECDREEVDGHCGCKRSLVGVKSKKATTTFTVSVIDKTKDEIRAIFMKSIEAVRLVQNR